MLSICIPTRNREKFLEKTLKHLLSFSKIEIEVCISNNNSDDNTIGVINQYKDKFKHFRYVTTPQTLDMLTNFCSVTKLASQKYTMFLSDDDLANEDDLLRGLQDLENNPNWVAIYSGFKKYDLDNNHLETLKFSEHLEVFNLSDAHKLPGRFISLDIGIHLTRLNKHLIQTHANYTTIGWETLSILLSHGDVCVAPYFFMSRFHHEDQCSNTSNNDPALNDVYFSSVETFLSKLNCTSMERIQALVNFKASYYRYRMWRSYKQNDLIYANININRGMMYSPDGFSSYAQEWDQKYLIPAVIQYITETLKEKPYLNRVFIYSNDDKKLAFLQKLVNRIDTVKTVQANHNTPIQNYDEINDFIIFFDDADMEEFGNAYNSDVFVNLVNRLKFTTQEISFSQ